MIIMNRILAILNGILRGYMIFNKNESSKEMAHN